ncbi:ribonuclease HIII [Spiroplasma platyhelix]|uniref:Ribonuclease n=1 Tax=Spiroplasma platyhelix PALS-1 TaxID=1276218 RepID=A0A846TWB8_9MOLU|nr:ribonuclease HIII [Spiroplasma platyhelix]MBE4703918.1 Ribonuclease HIII [Spiroplasma platyhelix PALS-1]NKE38291.1 ribonuclease HIII [Spiroplasma platyhelix PALS-1]UJB29176.1 ribonuclease HIII [Spiroplasma platyhelix PALS-1]
MIFYLSKEEKEKIINHYREYEIDSKNIHAQKVYKYNNLTITLYKEKVMFQGPWSEIITEYRDYWYIFDEKETFVIGNDEVGTGDYFGPIVVTSCYLGSGMLEKLRQLGIKDSKLLDDKTIYQLANTIMKIVLFESVVINNRKYNQWIEQGYNANVIKAWGHNQVLVKILQHKNNIEKIVIDQFVDSKLYYKYLENMEANKNRIVRDNVYFTTKAESKYLAVACSAIISRYLFLEEIKKISEEIKLVVPLGAGKPVTDFFNNNKDILPKDLNKFLLRHTKYHFANTKLIIKK